MFRLAPGPLGFDCLIAILTGTILVPQFMALRHVVDAVNTLAVGSVARSQPFVWLGVYLGLVGLSGLLATIGPAVQGRLREQLQCAIQSRIISKAQRLSLLTFERPELYNALRRIDESVEQRFPALFGSLGQLATGIAQSIGIGWFLLSQDARLLGFLLLGDLPRFALRWRLERESYAVRQLQTEQERRVDYLGFLMVGQRSAAEVRMLQLSSHLLQRWRHLFRTLRKERHGVFYRLAYSEIIGSVLQAVVFVLAMLSIVPAMEKGNLTLGDFVAILLAMQAFQSGIRSGLTQVATFTRDLGTVNQLLEFLDWPEEPVGAVIPGEAIPSFRQGICLEHVSFAYSDTGPPVLNNLCLNIRPGERIALVGRNGAGKSTLVRLILGLYTPTSGRILIDSVDLNEIGLGKWRQSASAVFQEPQRYEMTLRENITLSDYASTHDTERIAQCASICGVDTIAAALPQGFETPLGRNLDDGLVLSGGQWLRVSLARGLYRKASLLVLDEPTSVIDANGETQLYREFRDLTAGRTVIMISHRLGFAPLADRIVVLDGGEIAEDGTHHELLARRGLYATLFETQAQRYSLS